MCLPLMHLDKRTLAIGEHLGFAWEIVVNSTAHRCGYVRVGPDHPWYGKNYDEVDAECHGGLTFGAAGTACPTHDEKAEWWLGFDCAHGFDAPDPSIAFDDEAKMHLKIREECRGEVPFPIGGGVPEYMRETIKDTAYVERECRSLCEQAAAAMAATVAA